MTLRRPKIAKPTQTVAEIIRHHMGEIAALFDQPKITLVVRSPSLDADLIFTNDDPGDAIAAIRKMTEGRQSVIKPN